MSIEVTARHKDIHADLQSYAKAKAEAFSADYPKTSSVRVVLDFDRHIYKAQVVATVNGTAYVGEAEDPENIRKAIDDASDKADRQVRKQLQKLTKATRGAL